MFSNPTRNIQQLGLISGMHIADFGAGSGFYSMSLAEEVGDNGKVYAIDVQKDLLQKIKNEAKTRGVSNLEIIWGNVEKIGGTKMEDNSVDVVVIANMLFQAEDKNSVCAEAKRILKIGGRTLVVDWLDSFGGLGPTKENVFLLSSAKDLFKKNGFVFDKEFDAGDHHYGLIFKKQ